MKGTVDVSINGKSYPCRMTMGAILRFKRVTGRDISTVNFNDLADLAVLIWCCVASACNADSVEFGLSLEDFCDSISEDSMEALAIAIQGEGKEGGEQKKS